MKKFFILLVSIMPIFTAYAQDKAIERTEKLDEIVKSHLHPESTSPVHSILLYAENGKDDYVYHNAVGFADGKKEKAGNDYQFKIASITKMFTAVVILQLMEEGKIELETPAHKYLDKIDFIDFDTLHIFQNNSYGKSITVQNLLNHRSGLADIFTDKKEDFDAYALSHRQEQYDASKIFGKYYEYKLNEQAFFIPGSSYHYSDMNYVLLGLIAEQITGSHLAQLYRTRIYEPLGMEKTFLEFFESPTHPTKMAHSFLDNIHITGEVNTSFDWAGGGIVSTTDDLALFIKALFKGGLFRNEDTLDTMIDPESKNYGLGISKFQFGESIYYGHGGFWGALLAYSPEKKIVLSISINQVNPPFDPLTFVMKILEILE